MEIKGSTFEVKQTHTTIKEYDNADLPLYFKWDAGYHPWYYRVRISAGKLIVELLKETSEGLEYQFATVTCAFSKHNDPITEDEWRNIMHKFVKQLQD